MMLRGKGQRVVFPTGAKHLWVPNFFTAKRTQKIFYLCINSGCAEAQEANRSI